VHVFKIFSLYNAIHLEALTSNVTSTKFGTTQVIHFSAVKSIKRFLNFLVGVLD